MSVGLIGAALVIYQLSLPKEEEAKKFISLMGCATLMAFGGLGHSVYYVTLELVAVFACILAYVPSRRLPDQVKGFLVVLCGLIAVAFLYRSGHLTTVRESLGALSLLAISVAFATLTNFWFLVGGVGIMLVSFWNFGVTVEITGVGDAERKLSFAATPLVFGVLNLYFSWGSLKAYMFEKRRKVIY